MQQMLRKQLGGSCKRLGGAGVDAEEDGGQPEESVDVGEPSGGKQVRDGTHPVNQHHADNNPDSAAFKAEKYLLHIFLIN